MYLCFLNYSNDKIVKQIIKGGFVSSLFLVEKRNMPPLNIDPDNKIGYYCLRQYFRRVTMIGLEYILNLYNMEHQSLADKLGIKKQNINLWIKGKQNISKKYLPLLSEMFGIDEQYFQKELDDVDKLMVQKEKLSQELKPQVVDYETDITLGKDADFIGKPIYNEAEFNQINKEIEKAKLVAEYREVVSGIEDPIELQLMSQLSMLLRDRRKETIFEYTIDALSHYYDVLPDWVGEPESDEFVEEFLELAAHYDKKKIEG